MPEEKPTTPNSEKVKYLQLLDIEKVLFYFKHTQDGWNEYIFRSKFCCSKVKFTDEEKTNYVADLFNYFDDTILLLKDFKVNDNYLSALYDNIAVLQLMYIQQDLTNELFQIFLVEKPEDDNIIRYLRNELIGHPISRDKKTKNLTSSVFITSQTQDTTLEYIRYHKKNNYKSELKRFDWNELFAKQQEYLITHFNLLLAKIDEVLLEYKNVITDLLSTIDKLSNDEIVKEVEKVFERYNKNASPYSYEHILHNNSKLGQHPRYDYSNRIYIDGLKDSILETCRFIDEFVNREFKREADKPMPPKVIIRFSDTHEQTESNNDIEEVIVVKGKEKRQTFDYYYALSKLSNPTHPFGMSFFIREFANDTEIMTELENMQIPNSAEFHISYEYLRLLLQQRGLID